MRKSTLTATYSSPVERVWGIVTDNSSYAWRSDLDKVELIDDKSFIEHSKGGGVTSFTITEMTPLSRYAFAMEHKLFSGKWQGLFEETENGGTRIVFSEELALKNPLLELLSHIAMPLKKIQQAYAEDLRRELGEV